MARITPDDEGVRSRLPEVGAFAVPASRHAAIGVAEGLAVLVHEVAVRVAAARRDVVDLLSLVVVAGHRRRRVADALTLQACDELLDLSRHREGGRSHVDHAGRGVPGGVLPGGCGRIALLRSARDGQGGDRDESHDGPGVHAALIVCAIEAGAVAAAWAGAASAGCYRASPARVLAVLIGGLRCAAFLDSSGSPSPSPRAAGPLRRCRLRATLGSGVTQASAATRPRGQEPWAQSARTTVSPCWAASKGSPAPPLRTVTTRAAAPTRARRARRTRTAARAHA